MGDQPDRAGSSGEVVAHPKDAVFKYFLTQPVHAASLIRAVFPQGLVERLDLDHLELVPGSFVDEDLTDRHCDVLMRTRFAGREAFVFTIIEHQSSPDRMMSRTSRTSGGCGSTRIGGRAWLPCSPIFSR